MYEEAQANLEVLVQHGLSESVLAQFGRMLDEFDAVMARGRRAGRCTRRPRASWRR